MRAYVTLLSTDSYLDGVLALNESLKMVGSKYPLVVIVTKNISLDIRRTLRQSHIETIEVAEFEYSEGSKRNFTRRGMPHWSYTSNKLRIFGLTQYEKIIMLDADMMVIKNIDDLFDRPAFSATQDSPMLAEDNPIAHQYLNSGLLVIKPEKGLDDIMIKIAEEKGYQDQDTIRHYCGEAWIKNNELHLPQQYNIFAQNIPEYMKKGILPETYYVIHFIGKLKPFQTYERFPVKDFYFNYFCNLYKYLISKAIENLDLSIDM